MSAKRVPRGAVPSVNGMVADAGRGHNSGAQGMFFAVLLSRAGARPSDVMIADIRASGRCLQALFMVGAGEGRASGRASGGARARFARCRII